MKNPIIPLVAAVGLILFCLIFGFIAWLQEPSHVTDSSGDPLD